MKPSFNNIGLLVAAALASTLSLAQAAEHFWDEIPLSPSTTMPSEVLDDYWNSEFRRVNREVAAEQNTQLIFFGDSITWSWSLGPATGREIWGNEINAVMKRALSLITTLLLTPLSALMAADAPAPAAKPNILWIVMDDVGSELPCYG